MSSNETKDNFGYAIVDLIKDKPVEKITITELCQHANYSRETFYYHFKDKYDLIGWVYYNQLSWNVDNYYGVDDFYIMVSRLEKGVKNLKDFYISGFQNHSYHDMENLMIKYTTRVYKRMVKLALNKEDFDKEMEFLIHFNAAGSVYLVKVWLLQYDEIGHREFAQVTVNTLSQRLRKIFESYQKQ